MCEYCDCKTDNGISKRGEIIADSGYEECYIALDDYSNGYVIAISGDGGNQSRPILVCPFCGRNLKEQSYEL